jgi:octaprenyl-diphosphate synthase
MTSEKVELPKTLPENLNAVFSQMVTTLPGMDKVAEKVQATFESEHQTLQDISAYLFNLGGKRLRPILTLMVARAFSLDAANPQLTQIASGIELIHMATLLHDDIIDNSSLRRNAPSPLARFGMSATLLAGDFLLVRAFALCAMLDSEIVKATEEACVELTEGEIGEGSLMENVPTPQEYFDLIAAKKTASLFALGAFSAGHLAGLREEEKLLLREFGTEIGIAFQILDDILDVVSTDTVLGKKAGTDIRERKPSLINIVWIRSGAPLAQRLLTPPVMYNHDNSGHDFTGKNEEEQAYIIESLHHLNNEGSVISECRAAAQRFALSAKTKLHSVAESSSLVDPERVKDLDMLIEYTLERIS